MGSQEHRNLKDNQNSPIRMKIDPNMLDPPPLPVDLYIWLWLTIVIEDHNYEIRAI